ncbi:hypothetical protein QUF50_02800 [Thiotrichales bacterium HSG1]|nr:hypothetical protein [Thiotrichales bacterium HSG1]
MKELEDAKEFEERADFIETDNLMNWTVQNDFFLAVQKKILQRGAKLIVGPRGTGKTHQLKFAYKTCLKSKAKPLAIYVSFTNYYHLEPLLSKKANAVKIFHTWVLCKILLGCYDLLEDLDSKDTYLYEDENILSRKNLKKFCADVEKGTDIIYELHDEIINKVTIDEVIGTIVKLTVKFDRKRTILLLDDAALRLTPEYLIEFFDIFGSLKTINIAPKASVYPGTTVYGPRFHVGHDAEKVSSWLEIDNENYSQFMEDLIELRSLNVEKVNKDIVEIFKYAAFGIPRHFINLLRNYIQPQNETYHQRFNRVIEEQAESIKAEYLSFTKKLPQYQNIINTGWELHEQIVKIITDVNKNIATSNEKQLQFSILKEHSLTRDRMFQFLIEAGLLYELEEHKGSHNRRYERYIPHLLFLVKSRAFSISTGFNASEIIQFIKRRGKKHSIERELSKILNNDEIKLNLNLPSCQYCDAERLTEQQKFCHNCGKELVRQSTFDSCMKIKINELPFLTKLQKRRINEYTKLRIIDDFLSSTNIASELRKIPQIGPKRAEQISSKMKKMIEEFLS